ncbi:hypothetical protein Tsubulata_021053 [Turnera subulata]|uniref:F-box domain-containing protein n=1 Tax=Turnera subulata TaxID=218843 RepID=A0A9Q0FPI5_9ROSI|nr:hypothetical protein Tsubulata_021053 [Turnera subulata]
MVVKTRGITNKEKKKRRHRKRKQRKDAKFKRLELSDDILRIILSKLSFVDCTRLRIVCKRWKKLIEEEISTPVGILPWQMIFRWQPAGASQVKSICKLYDPSDSKTYTVEHGIKGEERKKFVNARPCFSKYGWVFFAKLTDDGENHICFVYSPFANEVIDLPELKGGYHFRPAFSSSPASTDCLFFCFCSKTYGGGWINICRQGDQAWTRVVEAYGVEAGIIGGIDSVVYLNGIFFCLFNCKRFGGFNAIKQEWFFLDNHCSALVVMPLHLIGFATMAESDGQLFMMFVDFGMPEWCIVRFDFSQNMFIKEEGLGNRALFSSNSNASLIPAVGDTSELADTINWPGLPPYSYKNGKSLQCCKAYSKVPPLGKSRKIWIGTPRWNS